MVTIKLTNQETKKVIKSLLPTRWENLTVGMFCRLLDLYKDTETPDGFQIVSALLNVPLHWIKDASIKQLDSNIFYYIQFLQDSKKWDEIFTMQGNKFTVNNKEYETIADISEYLTLGQKEDLTQVLNNPESTTLEKAQIVISTFYKDNLGCINIVDLEAAVVFPVVSFFLSRLKILMIGGIIRSGNLQAMKNILQA